MNLAGIALAFLLPAGVMMTAWGGLPPEQSKRAASAGLVALALATIAYAMAGFAFQFGGIWHITQLDAYRSLDQFWSMPDPTGNTWSVTGLAGFMLAGSLTPEAWGLFLHQLPLVMTAVLIPVLALAGRGHALMATAIGLAAGLFIAPLVGHWVWAGGAPAPAGCCRERRVRRRLDGVDCQRSTAPGRRLTQLAARLGQWMPGGLCGDTRHAVVQLVCFGAG